VVARLQVPTSARMIGRKRGTAVSAPTDIRGGAHARGGPPREPRQAPSLPRRRRLNLNSRSRWPDIAFRRAAMPEAYRPGRAPLGPLSAPQRTSLVTTLPLKPTISHAESAPLVELDRLHVKRRHERPHLAEAGSLGACERVRHERSAEATPAVGIVDTDHADLCVRIRRISMRNGDNVASVPFEVDNHR